MILMQTMNERIRTFSGQRMKGRSVSGEMTLIVIVLSIVMVSSVLLVAHISSAGVRDAKLLNELGVIRGSLQRAVKLELASAGNDELLRRIEAMFTRYRTSDLKRPIRENLDEAYSSWNELENAIRIYRTGSTAINRKRMVELSEMLWNSLNSTVFTAQVTSQKQIGLLRIVIAFMGVNCFILVILFLLIRRVLRKEIEYSANHDVLTGLFNRTSFTILLLQAVARTERRRTGLAVLMLDIDHFKSVNDTYGHDAGDRVLSRFATHIDLHVRKEDVFARIGGEEFALLIPADTEDAARTVATNILKAVSDTDFSPVPQLTVSIGISLYRAGETIDSFLKRADTALYRSKKEGRNRYTLAG